MSSYSPSSSIPSHFASMSLRAQPSSATAPLAAPTTTTTSTMTLPPDTCPLLLLPDALCSRVLQFLSAEYKLNELSHLCRRLTPLSPTAFHYSHLELSVASIAGRPRSVLIPPAALGVRSLCFDLTRRHQLHVSNYALLMPLLASLLPTAAARFASLRALCIQLHGYHFASNKSFLSKLIPSSAAFPHLERLTVWSSDLALEMHRPGVQSSYGLSLLALANLPSLQHLTLCLPLHTDDYVDILTLPTIHTISLCTPQHCELPMSQSMLTALPALLSPTCRTLRLPLLDNETPDMPHSPHISSPEQLMELITQQAVGRADGLQYLAVAGGMRDHALLLAPAFPALTALRVDAMGSQHDAAVVLPALASLAALQHLSIAVGVRPDKAVWEQFLSRAGPRLKTVHFRELHSIDSVVNLWIRMLLRLCTALESLELAMPQSVEAEGGYGIDAFHTSPNQRLSASLGSLSRLHTLRLYGLQLDNMEVEALLQACPLLEDCTLQTPTMSAGMLAVLGRCCPLLRRVWMEGQGEELLSEAAAESLLACVQPCGVEQAAVQSAEWFTHLRVLYIDWYGFYPGYAQYTSDNPINAHSPRFRISPRLTTLLPRLLAVASLRYLHLPIGPAHSINRSAYSLNAHVHEHPPGYAQLQWSSKQQLRAIDLPGTDHQLYADCTQPNPYARQQQVGEFAGVEEEDEWWVKASDSRMAAEPRMLQVWPRVFKDVGSTVGSDGRAEYFTKLQGKVEVQRGLTR